MFLKWSLEWLTFGAMPVRVIVAMMVVMFDAPPELSCIPVLRSLVCRTVSGARVRFV
jgi:hypothetical protein